MTLNPRFIETLELRRLMSFSAAVPYSTPATARAVATADFNRDGKPDVAAAIGYATTAKVSVRLGNGTGGFGTSKEFAAPTMDNPSSIFVADLNTDNKLDIILGGYGYTTLFGNGDGTFAPGVYHATGMTMDYVGHFIPGSSAVLAMSTWMDGDWATHVQLSWGDGAGGFTPAGQDGYYWGSSGLTPVNLNNDASIEVVTGDGSVFIGEAWGLRYDWEHAGSLRGGGVATGDLTGDGFADVIVANDSIAVMRGRGDCTLDAPVLYPAGSGTSLGSVATADFNGDGKLDVVVADYGQGKATVMIGNGDGTLRFGGSFAVGAAGSVVVGDFNRDGRPDVALANYGTTSFTVLLNDGNWSVLPPPPPPPATLSVGDVSVTEGNSGTKNAAFPVTLSKSAAADVLVYYGTQSGTAMPTEDFSGIGGSITIPAGQTGGTINIAVVGDQVSEPNETFAVNINGVTNAMLVDAQGTCTILNDDGKRWKGPASGGNWSTAGNWTPSGAPTASDHVVLDGAVSVNLGGSATFAGLTLLGGATLHVTTNGSRVLRTSSLGISADSKLNLNDNDLIIDYAGGTGSPMDDIVARLTAGRSALPTGIFSATANASGGLHALGVAEARDALGLGSLASGTFSGQTVDGSAVLVKYTYAGDANLDGIISGDDYTAIDFAIATPNASGWGNGDFNYDGIISGDDYTVIDFNIVAQGSPLSASESPKLAGTLLTDGSVGGAYGDHSMTTSTSSVNRGIASPTFSDRDILRVEDDRITSPMTCSISPDPVVGQVLTYL